MAHVLIMPRQGNTVESCIIQEWKVQENDTVKADTAVCIVETDKATFDVSAGADGIILKILHPAGDDVPVLQPIAVIGAPGEDAAAVVTAIAALETPSKEASRQDAETQNIPPNSSRRGAETQREEKKSHELDNKNLGVLAPLRGDKQIISPRAKNLAAKEGILPTAPGTGPGGRVIERDIKTALANHPQLTAAAKAAVAAGAKLPDAGTGIGGRITVADIIAAAGKGAALGSMPAIVGEGAVTETPIKGIRKIIADRMLASLSQSAQFTLSASACAVQLQELRNIFKSKKESKNSGEAELAQITVNDLILYTVSRVLPSWQYMNAHKTGDMYRTFERVHLGMAVDTPRGLMVPVLKNANLLSLKQISAEAKRLASVCQNGTAKPDELSGSTFTVSNLGSFGITGFTPVLNTPEVAILGVCGIELKPAEISENGECAFAPHISFSLTINHQVVDGAPAARFLKALCQAVENIYLVLAG